MHNDVVSGLIGPIRHPWITVRLGDKVRSLSLIEPWGVAL